MSSSLTRATLIDLDEADKYRKSCSCGFGMEIIGGLARYYFKLVKALSHSSVHLSYLTLFRAWKNGWHLSKHLEMNQLSIAIIPVSFCISLIEWELGCFWVLQFSLDSPLYPCNLPETQATCPSLLRMNILRCLNSFFIFRGPGRWCQGLRYDFASSYFLLACRPHTLLWTCLYDLETSWLRTFGKLLQHFSRRMAWLCSSKGLGWWWRLLSPDQGQIVVFDGSLSTHSGNTFFRGLLLSLLIDIFWAEENCPLDKLDWGRYSLHKLSIFHCAFWPLPGWKSSSRTMPALLPLPLVVFVPPLQQPYPSRVKLG